MTALLLAPAVLGILLLAAHFLRDGQWLLMALVLAAIPLLAVPRWWAMRLVQGLLVLGALEWVRTLVALAHFRVANGQPYLRMGAILGAVALVTALAALLFHTPRLRRRFGR